MVVFTDTILYCKYGYYNYTWLSSQTLLYRKYFYCLSQIHNTASYHYINMGTTLTLYRIPTILALSVQIIIAIVFLYIIKNVSKCITTSDFNIRHFIICQHIMCVATGQVRGVQTYVSSCFTYNCISYLVTLLIAHSVILQCLTFNCVSGLHT